MMTERQVIDWLRSLPRYREWAAVLGEYDPTYDYSGPENNKLLSKLIPSILWGFNLSPAFYAHDGYYLLGGDEVGRLVGDDGMKDIGEAIISKTRSNYAFFGTNWVLRRLAKRRLLKYYFFVRVGGKSSFNYTGSADA